MKVTLGKVNSMEDVQELVADSLRKYRQDHKFPKARKWIQRAAEKIHHYGTILDVFVQHHPEYVSLVWGTMKFLFVVSPSTRGRIVLR